MKKIVALLSVLSSPVIAHEVQPETKFFQEEIKKNPMIQQVLVWCSLVGLDSEEECKSEMYGSDNSLNNIRIEAASKCIEKSGLQYKVAFDQHFKDASKKAGLVSHDHEIWGRHLKPMKDPAKPKEPDHYYYHTPEDKQKAAFIMGEKFVKDIKAEYEGNSGTSTTGGSGSFTIGADGGVVKAETTMTTSGETAKTKTELTPEMVADARKKGEAYGKAHPGMADVQPTGYCVVGKNCGDAYHDFPESQLQAEVSKDVSPKSMAPEKEPPPEEPKDPFAPFTSETATGGMPTGSEKPKSDSTTSLTVESDEKEKTTPIHTATFVRQINDCLAQEEYQLLKAEGSKTVDPDAETAEEKKARAEADLKNGNCDESFYGAEFCQDHKNDQASREAQRAKEEAKAAKEQAMENFQKHGICDSMILGFAFCQQAKALQDMDKDNPTDEKVEGHAADGFSIPEVSTDPDGGVPGSLRPEGEKPGFGGRPGHISIDPDSINP